jgi:hypothetical protein
MPDAGQARPEEVSTGGLSRFFCVVAGIVAIGGGISLVALKAAGENSMIEAIAHGMGWYFIAKGLFMMAIPFQSGAIAGLLRR